VVVRTILSATAQNFTGISLLAILKLIVDGMLTGSNIPDNQITASQCAVTNSSASAAITITVYAVADK
jgi:hypothetical protein